MYHLLRDTVVIIPPARPPAAPAQQAEAASPNAQRGAAGGGPLGTNAKSSDRLPSQDQETRRKATRALRFQVLSEARHLFLTTARSEGIQHAGNVYRTAACRHLHHADINVMKNLEHGTAFYAGLVTCGSPWSCSVCASRIQERRRHEIKAAIAWAESLGLVCVMVTFTFPHRHWHRLADLIVQQREAFKRLRYSKGYRKVKPLGLIRSLELTYSDRNGWHPHTHELWFCEPDNVPTQYALSLLWEAAASRAGLLDHVEPHSRHWAEFMVHGVDVKRDMTEGDYLAKQDDSRSWGFAEEVSKATSKAGRRNGFHPFHFLVRKNPGDAARFLEYHAAMKGARQLFWSPGLKAKVGIDDLSDETIADESRDPADLLAHIPLAAWRVVRGNDAHAELLEAAETGGAPAVRSLLASLGWPGHPAQRGGQVRSGGHADTTTGEPT